MNNKPNTTPIPGWVGGFAQSNPDFAYPEPNLTSLPMPDNMFNIDRLQRQQKVLWPEFSWETEPGEEDPKRCYQMFAPDISRLGYTDTGRVYSIICPQQGVKLGNLGTMNVEVTVTGTRGWVDESDKQVAAEMGVVGKVWFSPSACNNLLVKLLWKHFNHLKLPFPSKKSQAITITTSVVGDPEQPIFPLVQGQTPSSQFPIPEFAKHEQEAWSVAHLNVQIGSIIKTGYSMVDKFNQLIIDIFNLGSGNMLLKDNILSWNVWFTAPELVDQDEWARHAWLWRESIDADHQQPGSPGTGGTEAKYYNGEPFKPLQELKELEEQKLKAFLQELDGKSETKIIKKIFKLFKDK